MGIHNLLCIDQNYVQLNRRLQFSISS